MFRGPNVERVDLVYVFFQKALNVALHDRLIYIEPHEREGDSWLIDRN